MCARTASPAGAHVPVQIFFRGKVARAAPTSCHTNHAVMGHPSKRRVDPMTRAELIAIRRRLRAVNIEYSGLVRNKLGDSRFVRMQELKAERTALVGLIVQNEKRGVRTVGVPMLSEPAGLAAH